MSALSKLYISAVKHNSAKQQHLSETQILSVDAVDLLPPAPDKDLALWRCLTELPVIKLHVSIDLLYLFLHPPGLSLLLQSLPKEGSWINNAGFSSAVVLIGLSLWDQRVLSDLWRRELVAQGKMPAERQSEGCSSRDRVEMVACYYNRDRVSSHSSLVCLMSPHTLLFWVHLIMLS